MKQKISYSSILSGLSICFFIVFVAIFVLFWVFINRPFDNVFFWILVGLFCVACLFIFGTMPDSIDADDDYVNENRRFSRRRYRYSDIKSAEVADSNDYPDRRLHFHGRFKNPVIITMKDGRQFVIGSDDPQQLVDYINNKLS
ncbi:MAG: hypothetical protein J1E82_07335 [Muribaculaceae bacterium]|nr:hypothetical protein [Muribaculaceae bacterium]